MTNSGRAEELAAGVYLTSGNPMPLPVEAELHNFTIFEDTSEIQRMIVGRSITGLDMR
jgi:hypothetical protein